MSKRWIWLVGLVCCAALAGAAIAENAAEWKAMSPADRQAAQQAYKANLEANTAAAWTGKRAFAGVGRQATAPNKVLGSITYHSGALGTCCQNSFMVGNQFDSALSEPLEMSGSVTMATFDMITVGGSAAFISLFDQLAGTAANLIISTNVSAMTGNNVATIAAPYVGSTFLAGAWQFNTDVPAVATGTTGGQGFHGISINDIVGTAFTTLGSLNAAFTATGDVLTPVELLNFDVE